MCIASATLTLALLAGVSAFAKFQAGNSTATQDTTRSALPQGYSYNTVSDKYNLLFAVISQGDLHSLNLICLDKDKYTVDVLVLPIDMNICVDGFEGTLTQAYRTDLFSDLVGASLLLHINAAEYISEEDFSALLAALDISAIEQLPSQLFELGSLKFCSLTSGILINGLYGDLTVADIIDLARYIDRITYDSVTIHRNFSDTAALADILNEYFRVKGSRVGEDYLGISIQDSF